METKNCPFCGEEVFATEKKCKHCGEWLEKEPPANIHIKVPELSLWNKIAFFYWITKRWILDEFILKDGILTVKCKTGKSIQSPLKDITSTFQNNNQGDIDSIRIKTPNASIRFVVDAPMGTLLISNEEYELIQEILQPEESGFSKTLGIVSELT